MNKFNIYVWVGLAINIALLVALIYMMQTGELTVGFSQEATGDSLKFMKVLIVIAAISIPLQIISMLTMTYWPQTSLLLAFVASIVFIPISLVFIFGMLFSSTQWRFRHFQLSSPLAQADYELCLNFAPQRNIILCASLTATGLVLFVLGQSLGLFLIVLAAFRFIIGRRISGTPLLAIKNEKLIFRPSFFANSYQIAIKEVSVIRERENTFDLLLAHDGTISKLVYYHKDIKQDQHNTIAALLSRIKGEERIKSHKIENQQLAKVSLSKK